VSDESEMDRVFDEFVEELISDMKETQQRWLELCQAVE
jgi:succinate dehydrogenase flavin-adding protein (antitoxin of CptAB toxin-antitoxin module)